MVDSGPVKVAVAAHDEVLAVLGEGRVEDARQLAAKAVDSAAAAFGPDSPELANVVLTCAVVEAIDSATAAFGRDSPDLANVMLTCAAAEQAGGDFTTAQRLAERAARIAAALADTDDAELLIRR